MCGREASGALTGSRLSFICDFQDLLRKHRTLVSVTERRDFIVLFSFHHRGGRCQSFVLIYQESVLCRLVIDPCTTG